jgi:Fe2+ transport system protein FeoA
MKLLKKVTKQIYDYWHKRRIGTHLQKFKAFNSRFKYNNMIKLSSAVPGVYKFVVAHCDRKLGYRLLEMGFVPDEDIIVIENTGDKGSIMLKVKDSKIALSNKIANNILLKIK